MALEKKEAGKGILGLGKGFSVLSDEKNVTEALNNDLKKAREQGYLSERCLVVE